MCMSTSRLLKLNNQSNKLSPTAFQFVCMALAIDLLMGMTLIMKFVHEFLPKKSKVTLWLPFASQ